MKKLILILSFLGAFFLGHSQTPQTNKTWWEYQTLMADTFGVKNDTVPIPSSLKNSKWSFLGAKDSVLYMWSILKQKYVPVGSGTTTINANWGSISGTLSSQTDLQAALNAKVPTAMTLTINGTTQDLSANRTWGPFLVPADTVWLHNQITANGTDNLTFSQGLLRAGNTVTALPDNALWNASKIESRSISAAQPLNGQALVWDSVNTQWKPGTVSSGSTYSAGFGLSLSSTTFKVDTSLITTNAHLYKVADSLGGLIGGGGSTPDLQAVFTAGSTFTTSNAIHNGDNTFTIYSGSESYSSEESEFVFSKTQIRHYIQDATGNIYTYSSLAPSSIGLYAQNGSTDNSVTLDQIKLYTQRAFRADSSVQAGNDYGFPGFSPLTENSWRLVASGAAFFASEVHFHNLPLMTADDANDANDRAAIIMDGSGNAFRTPWQFYKYTPSSSSDTAFPNETLTYDDTYIYFRKSTGTWVKIAWTTF